MKYDILIKNGELVTDTEVRKGDIAILGDKIAKIFYDGDADRQEAAAEKEIDAFGKLVFPGAIDTHAHLNEPGYEWREDYEHATRAAAIGGYTTIIDMPLQNEPALTTAELFERKKQMVEKNAYVDFAFWGGLVPDNFDEL